MRLIFSCSNFNCCISSAIHPISIVGILMLGVVFVSVIMVRSMAQFIGRETVYE